MRDPETGEPALYVLVRANLEALIDRKSFYRLVEIGEYDHEGTQWFGVRSQDVFFRSFHQSSLRSKVSHRWTSQSTSPQINPAATCQ